jgi:hypothetical protein
MMQTGVLPERHEDLERVPSWIEHHLAGKSAGHASLVRPLLCARFAADPGVRRGMTYRLLVGGPFKAMSPAFVGLNPQLPK